MNLEGRILIRYFDFKRFLQLQAVCWILTFTPLLSLFWLLVVLEPLIYFIPEMGRTSKYVEFGFLWFFPKGSGWLILFGYYAVLTLPLTFLLTWLKSRKAQD